MKHLNNLSKGKAYVICLCMIAFIFGAMCVTGYLSDDYSLVPAGACLAALVTITTTYMGIQTANNGVKGKYWNSDMAEFENKEKEGK
ncbi:MAG: hypothetical protein LBH44_07650 [Treponema sp.]|jgi:hypothetical protein|nr:hypothetical protein [Treponema sp.]